MSPEDQYPSTEDCARRLEHGDDAVELCLRNARRRYADHGSRNFYALNGESCAMGSVWATELTEAEIEQFGYHGAALAVRVDEILSEEAKLAIELLNEAALELFPEALEWSNTFWAGPLEWVNQEWMPEELRDRPVSTITDDFVERADREQRDELVKAAVLRIYDKAITDRREFMTR